MKKMLIALAFLLLLSQAGYAAVSEYTNPDFGIMVKYPKEWSLVEDKTATMIQLAISPYLLRSTTDLKNASYIATIAVFKNNNLDIESYVKTDLNSMMAANKIFKIVENQNTIDLNGKKWARYKYQLDSLLTTKYVYKDMADNSLIVASSEEYSYAAGKYANEFEEIVKSISFLKAEK